MDAAQPGETGVLQTGNQLENRGLRAVFHLGLETDDVVQGAKLVVAAELDHGIGLLVRLVCIGQAHRLHRAVAQRLAAAFGHDLDGQAAVEIARRLALVEFGLLGGEEGVDEGLILLTGHRAVDIGLLLILGFALVVAALQPGDRHVYTFCIYNWRDRIEESQRLGPGGGADAFRQRGAGQRAGGDDPVAG